MIDKHIEEILPDGLNTPFPQGLPEDIRERSQAKIVRFVQTSAPEATNL